MSFEAEHLLKEGCNEGMVCVEVELLVAETGLSWEPLPMDAYRDRGRQRISVSV